MQILLRQPLFDLAALTQTSWVLPPHPDGFTSPRPCLVSLLTDV